MAKMARVSHAIASSGRIELAYHWHYIYAKFAEGIP